MATHFVFQSTEPLQHVYQSRHGSLSHGPVSQYEIYNESKKPHTQFPPPGWDFSQTSEEDSLPLVQTVPLPEWKDTSVHPDPELCITPLKPKAPKSMTVYAHPKPVIDADPLLTLTPEKPIQQGNVGGDIDGAQVKRHRVRFDVEEDAKKWEEEDSVTTQNLQSKCPQKSSPEKVYQPELYGDDNDKFDFTSTDGKCETNNANQGTRTVKYTVGKVNSQPVYIPLTDTVVQHNVTESHEKLPQNEITTTQHKQNKSQTVGSKTVKVIREKPKIDGKSEQLKSIDPIALSVVPEQNGPRRRAKVLRENQSVGEGEYTYPFEKNPLEFPGGEEHMFARPEYNSTLRMKVEAEKLKNSSIDIERALQKKLTMSESTKTSIHEKAAAQVNANGRAFTGLVSLDVPAEELCKHVSDQKTARAKQVKVSKKKLMDHKEPDLMDFFTDDRQKESVTFALPGISAPSEKLSTVPHRRAFDLYKHNRVWEIQSNLSR